MISKVSFENLDIPLDIPARKLDADHYSADDLDGVTESLFGSGNMAYASLQASQTDAAMQNNDPVDLSDVNLPETGGQNAVNADAARSLVGDNDALGNSSGSKGSAGQQTTAGNNGDNESDVSQSDLNNGGFASSTVGSVSASQLSSDVGSFAPAGSGLNLAEGLNGSDGESGQNGETPDAPDVDTPSDGQDGQDGEPGSGDTIINIDLGDVNVDITETIDLLETLIIELGDSITNVSDFLTEVTNVLGDVVNNTTNNLFEAVDVTDIVNTLTQTINNTLTKITNIKEVLTDVVEELGELVISLDLNALDTGILGVDIPLGDIASTDLELDVDLAPAYELLNNVADLTGIQMLGENLAELDSVVNSAQSAINQITDIVSDLDLHDPGASVEQVVDILANLDDTVADITASVEESIEGILGNLGLGEDDGTLGDVVDGAVGDVGDLANSLTGGVLEDVTAPVEEVVDTVTDVLDGLTDETLDDLAGGVADGLDGLTNGVTPVLESVGDALGGVEGILGSDVDLGEGLVSGLVDPVTEDVLDVVDGLTGGVTEDMTDGVQEVVDDVTDTLDGLVGGLFGQNNDDAGADSDLTLDLGIGDPVEINLDPVEDLVGDVDLDLGLGIFGGGETDNNAGDEDVLVETGIDLVDNTLLSEALDAPLDPVEELTGDLDLDVGAAVNLFGDLADPIVNDGEGGTGGDGLLSGLGEVLGEVVGTVFDQGDNDPADLLEPVEDLLGGENVVTDVLGNTVEDILGDNLLAGAGAGEDLPLDPVEELTSGLEDGITSALGLLGGGSSEDEAQGDSDDDASWTESAITDGGGLFGDIANGTDGLGDALPDPVGTVVEGIGVLDVEPEIDLGSLGGLFG